MLLSLQVKNFALIESLTLEMGEGFHVLSGETGAGKSILVQAFEVLFGGRAYVEFIREGQDEAEVCGLFKARSQEGKLEEVSLRRVLNRSGKSRAYINERPVTVQALEEMSRQWVDLVSQHEHQVLLQPEKHLELLDQYSQSGTFLISYQESLKTYKTLLQEKIDLQRKEKEAREKEDFFRFQLRELSEAKLKVGEEEELKKEKDLLKNAVSILKVSEKGEILIDSSEDSLTRTLNRYLKDLSRLVEVDPVLSESSQRLESCLVQLQDVARSLKYHADHIAADPDRLEDIESRLHLLLRLQKKYAADIPQIIEKKNEIEKSLGLLDSFEFEIKKVDQSLLEQAKTVISWANKLHAIREETSQKLAKDLVRELGALGFKSAKIEFHLKPLSQGLQISEYFLNESGFEEGEFLFAPNTGEGFKPLAKIASGGEISRVFLALKKVLGTQKTAETYIFDEVDTGIGGAIAEVVGKSLRELSQKKQVICVTHLPQIACFADQHFVISKTVIKGRTVTAVKQLSQEEQIEELARMLAGVKITEKALAHAREMIQSFKP